MRLRMIALLVSLLGAASAASAASVALGMPATVTRTATGSFASNASSYFASGYTAGNFATQVQGRAITNAARWGVAANAAEFAVAAIRFNPTALVVGAVATWAIGYGIEWVNNAFMKKQTYNDLPTNTGHCNFTWNGSYTTTAANCIAANTANVPASKFTYSGMVVASSSGGNTNYYLCYKNLSGGSDYCGGTWLMDTTPACATSGAVFNSTNATCGAKSYVPVTESDWSLMKGATSVPDAALNEMTQKGVAFPLTPVIDPKPALQPLGNSYPVGSTNFRDFAQLTPDVSNPGKGDLQVLTYPVDANGNPQTTTNPDGSTKTADPTKDQDQCSTHPNRIGCMETGDIPATPDLLTKQQSVSVTPDGGWGSDTAQCPGDLNASFLGQRIAWSFQPVCTGADMMRPVVIALAWVSAALITIGMARKNS